jgi:hypothetical protein
MTGTQPAARASNNVGCPSLAPRMTKQNLARCKEEISSAYIQFKWAGRSGDQILVRRDFPHLARPVLGPTQPPIQ